MNPLTNVKNLQKLNERELRLGISGQDSKSWHQKYKDSAWIFVGGLPYTLSEGDIISVFSQYGEIVNVNLIRDRQTGKSRGFGFICYEDQRSTNLTVDNLNGIKLLNRTIRVDHVEEYKIPKEKGDEDELIKNLHMDGCGPVLTEKFEDSKVEKPETDNFSKKSSEKSSKFDLKSPKPEKNSPKREHFSSKSEKFSPKREHFSPKRDKFSPPKRQKISPRREKMSPKREENYRKGDNLEKSMKNSSKSDSSKSRDARKGLKFLKKSINKSADSSNDKDNNRKRHQDQDAFVAKRYV